MFNPENTWSEIKVRRQSRMNYSRRQMEIKWIANLDCYKLIDTSRTIKSDPMHRDGVTLMHGTFAECTAEADKREAK